MTRITNAIVLSVAATCMIGVVVGAVRGDWVLFSIEVPAVVGIGVVGRLWQRRHIQSKVAQIAAAIGLLCAAELWFVIEVLDGTSVQAAVVGAGTTAVLLSGAAIYWWTDSRNKSLDLKSA